MGSKAPPCDATEHQIIERAKQGDRGAFGELVRRHRIGVINLVFRMCGDAHLAEDMAQEAFIRAWRRIASFQPKATFRSWLYRIATNVTLDALRREKGMADIDELVISNPEAGPEASFSKSELSTHIQQSVLSLPPASRMVLVLREYEGLSYREIAETLDIPIGTVMSRLNFARNRLRQILGPFVEDS